MGQHNVVIACSYASSMGIIPSAVVATKMEAAFHCLQIRLMVGVGSGVPDFDTDVRLGDVVISQPSHLNGGVVQHDVGIHITHDGFQRTGSLNAPPKHLLDASADLRTRIFQGRSRVWEHLTVFETFPEFSQKNASPDILFQGCAIHMDGPTCEYCNDSWIILRRERAQKVPVIHFGAIASGNQVIKDAQVRDRIHSDLGGVLCFETEGAGIVNHFPCLNIRGICDYADSHGNKRWHPYAASTAAACAKEILALISLANPSKNELQDGCRSQTAYDAYTVAVICAMSFEMSAVRYLLDREHTRLPTRQGDSTIYILGELNGHNIVLACLPGIQGKGSAATVATNMARIFPSISLRFLVGIGGGIPSDKHDIRLGDVVVSMPEGQNNGVIQYDLGKDTDDGFTLKGFLWPPPAILRSAVEMMRSDHLINENKVDEFLSTMLQKGPRLSIYNRPSAGSDMLFESGYPHTPQPVACEKCDRTKIVDRPPRQHERPEIHYGLIASGDRVMRSAVKRNTAVRDAGDILCFEMEVAGLMTEYSCIVIRGISDYADSHKSDSWQHYAAVAAAACAKELLSYLNVDGM